MIQTVETYDMSRILQPAQSPEIAKQDAARFAASTTFVAGLALGRKTADGLLYPMVPGASDGTQLFVGFSMYDFLTDASSLCYLGSSITAGPNIRQQSFTTMAIWVNGIFNPQDVQTKGTPTGEVDTFTPATVTTGDVNVITFSGIPGPATSASFTIGATATATAAVAGLTAAWNANPILAALGTASGTTTFIVTSKVTGTPLNLTSAVTGTGTLTRVQTTAPAGRSLADILVGRPGAYQQHNGFWNV